MTDAKACDNPGCERVYDPMLGWQIVPPPLSIGYSTATHDVCSIECGIALLQACQNPLSKPLRRNPLPRGEQWAPSRS